MDTGWVVGARFWGSMTMNSTGSSRITDLARELEGSVDKSNRIVERFLLRQVRDVGLNCGRSSAMDMAVWMRREGIRPPNGCKSLIKWLNWQLKNAILVAQPQDFRLQEIDGARLGINFAWWFDEGMG